MGELCVEQFWEYWKQFLLLLFEWCCGCRCGWWNPEDRVAAKNRLTEDRIWFVDGRWNADDDVDVLYDCWLFVAVVFEYWGCCRRLEGVVLVAVFIVD